MPYGASHIWSRLFFIGSTEIDLIMQKGSYSTRFSQIVKKTCPIRPAKFDRHSHISAGHSLRVTYIVSLQVWRKTNIPLWLSRAGIINREADARPPLCRNRTFIFLIGTSVFSSKLVVVIDNWDSIIVNREPMLLFPFLDDLHFHTVFGFLKTFIQPVLPHGSKESRPGDALGQFGFFLTKGFPEEPPSQSSVLIRIRRWD